MPKLESGEPERGFTSDFIWGTNSSATQVEGAARQGDWFDWEAQGNAPRSGDGNGFKTQYSEDFSLYASFGLSSHRLSIDWARIEPSEGRRDGAAIEHTRWVLESARDAGMEPWVCLHHIALPGWFTELGEGGFRDDKTRSYFWARHVAYCAETFGDLVAGWQPLHQPTAYASDAFLNGVHPPGAQNPAKFAETLRGMVFAWRDAWRELRGGPPVATALNLAPIFSIDNSPVAEQYARDADAVIWKVWMRALRDGVLTIPGLPEIEIPELRDSCDMVGFSYESAIGVTRQGKFVSYPNNLRRTALGIAPWVEGLSLVLHRLSEELPDRPLLITGLGIGTDDDAWRCDYLQECFEAVEEAINDGIDIRGIFHQTGIDQYEWLGGYETPFGLFTRDREPRASAEVFAEYAKKR